MSIYVTIAPNVDVCAVNYNMEFKNKVVLVTGGSSGIGAATAIKLSRMSAKIAIVGRNGIKLKNVSGICEKNGSQPLVIIADVTKEEDLKRIMNNTLNHFGKLDVLVNNAGIHAPVSILEENAMQMFDQIMATNLRSIVYLTHLAAPHLIKTKGNIVNTSSTGAMSITFDQNFSYCTSKAGLNHFSNCIALELAAKGVRVNCVNPGPVRTDCVERITSDKDKQEKIFKELTKITALGKIAEPEEIADVILFLASDNAKSITGSSYVVDNGLLLKNGGL